jgi:DNA (cytosine-5)-methyltransferase 1
LQTVTSLDRFGLVTRARRAVRRRRHRHAHARRARALPRPGLPDDYLIDIELDGKPLPNKAQVRMVGNSVCPPVAAALARAQFEDQVIEIAA